MSANPWNFRHFPRAPLVLPAALSHWQAGCDDGKAGSPPRRPFPNVNLFGNWHDRLANQGYMNGYQFGVTRRYEPVHDEGSHAD